eukprot:scaffold171031_cov35-Attheya_sp.AAC.1
MGMPEVTHSTRNSDDIFADSLLPCSQTTKDVGNEDNTVPCTDSYVATIIIKRFGRTIRSFFASIDPSQFASSMMRMRSARIAETHHPLDLRVGSCHYFLLLSINCGCDYN